MQPAPPPQQPPPYAVGDFAQYLSGGNEIKSGYIRQIYDAVVNQRDLRWYKFVDNQNDLQNPEVLPHTIDYIGVEKNQDGQFIWHAMEAPVQQQQQQQQQQQGAAVGGRRRRSRRVARKSRRSGRKSHRSTRRR